MKKTAFIIASMIVAPYAMAANTSSITVSETGIVVTGKTTPKVFLNKGVVKNGKRTFWVDVPSAKNVVVKPEMKKITKIRNIRSGGIRVEVTVDEKSSIVSSKNAKQRVFSFENNTVEQVSSVNNSSVIEKNTEIISKIADAANAKSSTVTNIELGPNQHDDTDRLIFTSNVNNDKIKLLKKSDKEWVLELDNNVNIPEMLIRDVQYPASLTIEKTQFFKSDNGKKNIVIKFKAIPQVTLEKSQNGFTVVAKKDYEAELNQSKKNYTGKKVTLNFQKIEVRAVLQVIAEFTNLNIIASEKVSGDITLALKDVPWDQALDMILTTKGLDMRKNGNVIWVGARDEIAQADAAEINAQTQKEQALPLISETIQINHQKAADIVTLLTSNNQKMLSSRGSINSDKFTNTLFIRDTSERLQEIKALIKRVDIPVRQVLVKAKIIETEVGAGKTLGAKLGFGLAGRANSGGFAIGSNIPKTTNQAQGQANSGSGATNNFFSAGDGLNVNLPATGLSSGATNSTIGLSLFNSALTKFVSLEVSALEAENNSKSISQPSVVVNDNIEAVLSKGVEIPYQEQTSSGATSTSFKQAGLSLKVKPQITADGTIKMDIDLTNGVVGQTTQAGLTINNTALKTSIAVQDGGSLLIGGIIVEDESNTTSKVPFFGDIPVMGNLFKNNIKTKTKRELSILLEPVIVK